MRALAFAIILLAPLVLPADATHPVSGPSISIDASGLPGPTGWFATAITAKDDAWFNLSIVSRNHGSHSNGTAVFQLFSAPSSSSPAVTGGTMSGRWESLEIRAMGHGVDCCNQVQGEWSGGAGGGRSDRSMRLDAGETIWIGLVAVNRDRDGQFFANLTIASGNLVVGPTRSGTDVALVDLVDESRRNGVGAWSGNGRIAGVAGEAAWEWESTQNGIMTVWAMAYGDGHGATVDVVTPAGHAFDAVDIRDDWRIASAQGPGTYAFRISDVREEAPYAASGGALKVLALVADVDIPGAGLYVI